MDEHRHLGIDYVVQILKHYQDATGRRAEPKLVPYELHFTSVKPRRGFISQATVRVTRDI